MDDFVSALRDRRPPAISLKIKKGLSRRSPRKTAQMVLDFSDNNLKNGGDERDRTADLLVANETLSQLSYIPMFSDPLLNARTS
jgi:hypothetical protein